MSDPRVSIVLPFRNAKAHLPAALDSIRSQTFENWELILFDDGSTDGSSEIARALTRADPRVRIVQSAPVGLLPALERACVIARGEFIARMDGDDVSCPTRLELQLDRMESEPGLAICGGRVRVIGDRVDIGRRRYETWVNSLITHDDIVRELFVECPIPHPTFFMRRGALEQLGGYRATAWPEDYDLLMKAWIAGMRLGKVDSVVLDWRERPDRLSRTDPRYESSQFRALKRHYLRKTYLSGGQGGRGFRPFIQWGAGEVGKRWLREWGAHAPQAVVDINPRKLGRRIHHIPVIAPDDLPPRDQAFVVVAVGAPGSRDEIRAWLALRGYLESRDYVFVA
jgi:glycosyltransferase involved in cell wall biosynthesis